MGPTEKDAHSGTPAAEAAGGDGAAEAPARTGTVEAPDRAGVEPPVLPGGDPYGAARVPRRWLSRALLIGGVGAAVAAWLLPQLTDGPPPEDYVIAVPPTAPDPLSPAPTPPPVVEVAAPARRPQVELVFALDTTGSMDGLIEGAKRKIWSLASFVARGQPTPDLRIGLVAYRDVGDAYVTRVFDLDDDLDRVYERLRALRADGGGDTPEHVGRALHEAVHRMSWTLRPEVVKVVYLVGDAPPHDDYRDGFDAGKAARAARDKGIEVHAIRCGDDAGTASAWRRLARLGGGQFLTIPQDGGVRDEPSPYDDELARLQGELTGTAVAYGRAAEAKSTKWKGLAGFFARSAPKAVAAERAAFMAASGKATGGEPDLVDDVAGGRVRLDAIAAEELPAELRGLNQEDRKQVLAKKQAERARISARIKELTALRERHLDSARKDVALKPEEGFDVVAKKALRDTVSANAAAGLKL